MDCRPFYFLLSCFFYLTETRIKFMKKYLLMGMALCAGFFSYAQQAINFKLNPEIGKPMTLNMLMKTDIDGPQSVIMDMKMQILMTPQRVEAENFVIEATTKTIAADIDAGMMQMSYNSTEDPTDEMGKMLSEQFAKIIGQTITFIVSPKGKTILVDIPEALADGVDKASYSNINTEFPEMAVAPGATWISVSETDNNPLLAKTETTSTFREETADGYIIDVVGKLLDAETNEVGNVVASYTLDKKTHFTKLANIKTSLELEGTKVISDVSMTIN